jgi:hypothetical protein
MIESNDVIGSSMLSEGQQVNPTGADYMKPNAIGQTSETVALTAELSKLGEVLGAPKPYDSQLPIAEIAGTRIVKCLYQVSKTGANAGKKKQENTYYRLPVKHLTEELIVSRIAELSPYVLGYLQEIEDKEIKAYHAQGGIAVRCESLSIDKIIEALEASEAGARLNKEKIEAWFVAELQDSLAVAFAERLGISESSSEAELEKLEMVLNAYKAKFASLAGGKTYIKEADCIAMIAVIVKADAESSLLGKRFIARLEGMKKKEDDLLLSL